MSFRFSRGARLQRGRGVQQKFRLAGNKRCNKNNVETTKYKRSKNIKKYLTLNKNFNKKKILKIQFLKHCDSFINVFTDCDLYMNGFIVNDILK